jgi:hypothetical protein
MLSTLPFLDIGLKYLQDINNQIFIQKDFTKARNLLNGLRVLKDCLNETINFCYDEMYNDNSTNTDILAYTGVLSPFRQ